MKNFEKSGFQIADILLPKNGINLSKWAVIACDQFTSQLEYWQQIEDRIGAAPSTLRMILPEAHLERGEVSRRIAETQEAMHTYLQNGTFRIFSGLILVERKVTDKTRYGLMLALDLEQYDFSKGSQSLIRATEGTIIERIPPRVQIREDAPLEFPHIIVLIDDPLKTVIEPAIAQIENLRQLYDFELLQGSGHLRGYAIENKELEDQITNALEKLADLDTFKQKYGLSAEKGVLLFAVGDGNHSLATAKTIWEKKKNQVGMDDPSRYALVEVENVHDTGLEFEPIHRNLFNVQTDILAEMQSFFGNRMTVQSGLDESTMVSIVDDNNSNQFQIGFIRGGNFSVIRISEPSSNLPVGELQNFLDQWLKKSPQTKIDYVHGADVTFQIGNLPGNCGFYLPTMKKADLFKTVILDGALPRKTFSMGAAKEKRFYMEGRRIK